jgi:surface polysaccharide O-acyltransferase-like enzyme
MNTPIVNDFPKTRASNFELLRLVCMFYILLHHFIVLGLKSAGYEADENVSFFGVLFNSFFIIAVNCFILISGYFGIKSGWKGFVRLWVMCLFYGIVCYIFLAAYNGTLDKTSILHAFFPFAFTEFWFIQSYFYLLLAAPLLNKIADSSTKKEFGIILILWLILRGYNFLRNGDNGYNIMNFMTLYLLGRFIGLYAENIPFTKSRIKCMLIYLLCSIMIAGSVFAIIYAGLDSKWIVKIGFAYSNPIVICSAIAFLLFFKNLKIKSKTINWCASSALAIYLISSNSELCRFLYAYIGNISQRVEHDWLLSVYLPVIAIITMIICIAIDKIRMVITNPVEQFLDKICLSVKKSLHL